MTENTPPVNVLFVCMGNICRSPAAEGIFKAQVQAAGLAGRIECDSAGTIGFHSGQPADSRMRSAAQNRGYLLTSRSRQVESEDFQKFDYIIVMDRENHRDLSRWASGKDQEKISLMGDYSKAYPGEEVPDPYYTGRGGFEHVLDLLEDACAGLLDHIRNEAGG